MIRVVLDANIYVSAFLKPSGLQAKILEMAFEGKYQIILSREIFEEICSVLQRKKIQARLSVSLEEVIKDLERLATIASWTGSSVSVSVCEDPNDDIYLACAKESQADFIVSGDQHLLKLKHFERAEIITSREFHNL